ncbi:hypothetical protein [Corynebacterium sp.]|uniref:hypothetical protein n=1 Tax=Corynebacterium sp. TaxID=1720 RepID=UPI002649499D|nr:hypothetical protein [Corynebacterium sp.]MDN6136220.1 hypothetical protein [Corynebacterium sp.]MDN6737801.1 hypothetical protein [Corynebacterium sp.]
MPVGQPSLYLGLGIEISNGSGAVLANPGESARDAIEDADMDFKEALFNADAEPATKSPYGS